MLQEFYQVLRKQIFQGEEWRILKFFQKGDMEMQAPRYVQWLDSKEIKEGKVPSSLKRVDKTRLTEKLSRMILLVDPNKFENAYKKQVFRAYQKMLIARFLRYLNFEKLARQNAYKALKIGLKYELQHIIINTSELLMTLSSLFGQSRLFNYYKQLHLNAIQTQQKESFINIDFLAIKTHFVNSSQFTPSIDQELLRAIKYTEEAYQQEGTYTILEHLTRLRSFYYELHHSYKALQSTWAHFDAYLQENPKFYHPTRQGESFLRQMIAYINLGDISQGYELGKAALSQIPSDSLNWFYFCHVYSLYLTRNQHYQEAYQLLNEVFESPKFKKLPENLKENFLLHDGFLAFAAESGLTENFTHSTIQRKGYFPTQKLINDLPHLSKDKSGVNALLILLEALFCISRFNYEDLYQMQDTIKLYKTRHLKYREHKRMYLFFEMLQALIKSDLDIHVTNEKIAHKLERLKSTGFQFGSGYEDFEVIPLEKLWDWITRKLQS